jgi:hypothetical protein
MTEAARAPRMQVCHTARGLPTFRARLCFKQRSLSAIMARRASVTLTFDLARTRAACDADLGT